MALLAGVCKTGAFNAVRKDAIADQSLGVPSELKVRTHQKYLVFGLSVVAGLN